MTYYQINFTLKYHFHWSLEEINRLIPYEREFYIIMISQQKEKERLVKAQQQGNRQQ